MSAFALIALQIKAGVPVQTAVDKVLGKGAYQDMENRLYDHFTALYGAE